MDSRKNSKKAAGNAAASLIQDGMIVGLGSGSTVKYFIQNLANRYRSGLRIQTIPSSLNTELLAKEEGLPLLDSRAFSYVDITVDGADEIDSNKRLIKGGGGALLREKILASSSKEFIVIIDESK